MSNTSWDVVTVINTAPINQQLTDQLRNTAINFTSTSSDQVGDKVSLASTIVDLALLPGSSGQTLILAITLNGSISFAMAGGGNPVAYGLDQLVLPMQCVVKSFADAGTTTVSLPLSSALLASDQLNQTAAVAALVPQGNALSPNAGLIQAVATAVANGLQQTTAVGAELARISDLTIAHAQAPVQQIGCAVQPIAGGSLLFMMLSYSGSTPLQADVDASLSAALSEREPNQAVVFIAQDFFMDTIFGSGTLPNGQGFAYSPATATLSLPSPFVMASSGGTLQQFTWQAIGSGLNVAASAVWSSGSGAMNVTITATFNATYIPVIQGGMVTLVPQNPPTVNQNVDKGWLAEVLGIATAFGGHPVQQLYNSISSSMASNVASLVQTSLLGTIAHLVSWNGSGSFIPTAATLNDGLSVVGTILSPPS